MQITYGQKIYADNGAPVHSLTTESSRQYDALLEQYHIVSGNPESAENTARLNEIVSQQDQALQQISLEDQLLEAVQNNDIETVSALVSRVAGNSPLVDPNTIFTKKMTADGIVQSEETYNALYKATASDNIGIMDVLLENGANPNSVFTKEDGDGHEVIPAICIAAINGNIEAVATLLSHGALVNSEYSITTDEEESPEMSSPTSAVELHRNATEQRNLIDLVLINEPENKFEIIAFLIALGLEPSIEIENDSPLSDLIEAATAESLTDYIRNLTEDYTYDNLMEIANHMSDDMNYGTIHGFCTCSDEGSELSSEEKSEKSTEILDNSQEAGDHQSVTSDDLNAILQIPANTFTQFASATNDDINNSNESVQQAGQVNVDLLHIAANDLLPNESISTSSVGSNSSHTDRLASNAQSNRGVVRPRSNSFASQEDEDDNRKRANTGNGNSRS